MNGSATGLKVASPSKDCLFCGHGVMAHALMGPGGTCAGGERKVGPFGLFRANNPTCLCDHFRFPTRR